jgi:hypothetical protein
VKATQADAKAMNAIARINRSRIVDLSVADALYYAPNPVARSDELWADWLGDI